MLNKNGERELAYVVTVDAIRPIEGRDRVECAVVGGWTIMVRKGQFKPGDPGIYFEIDSKVPEREPFEFLAPKHYRIKTQKYKTPRGQFWSQGLLMAAEDFGWTPFNKVTWEDAGIKDKDCAGILDDENIPHFAEGESRFLTKKIGVAYAEAEDNKRKAGTPDKYKAMSQRHGKLFAKQPFRWLMRRKWGKRLLFVFFGKKRDNNKWPQWVKKTDEERCLAGKTKISTDQGELLLSTIVNRRMPVKVKSVNVSTGKIEYKPIVSYQKYKTSENLFDISFVQENDGDTKINRVICTGDHKFYVDGKYVRAKDLKVSDRLTRCKNTLPQECLEVLYGIVLGDGCVSFDKRHVNSRAKFSYTQHKDHEQYYELIRNTFGLPNTYVTSSGYTGKHNILRFMFSDQLCSGALEDIHAIKDNHIVINDAFCDSLTIKSVAVWYLDDGTLRHRDDGLTPTAEISSCSFTKEENELLIKTLHEKFGIECSLKHDSKRGFFSIYISADGTEKLSNMIAPFVPECMRYKLTKAADKKIPFDSSLWKTCKESENTFSSRIVSIDRFIDHTNGYHVNGTVYDIEVEENHNFFANGVLTHNCQNMPWILSQDTEWSWTEKIDGTSTTWTMRRGKHRWSKPEFIVASRNVPFKTGKEACFYDTNVYTEIAEKYDAYGVLWGLLKDRPTAEWVTVQGEIYGDGIQKRSYGLTNGEHRFAAFNLIYSDIGRVGTREMIATLSTPCVPYFGDERLPDSVDEVLKIASGESVIDGGMREGLVFRSPDGSQSFKAVSNDYLLKYH